MTTPLIDPPSDSRTAQTRESILNASEQLFIEQGHDATSLRQITRAAHVNLAAVNYHFGSKEALVQAVLKRRLGALNELRMSALDALETASGGAPLKPSQILDAFFGTLLRMAARQDGEGAGMLILLERTMTDPAGFIHTLFAQEYGPVLERFRQALFRALPDVPQDEIIWRFQFMLGATSFAIVGPRALRRAVGWQPVAEGADDIALLLPRLMSFLIGGLRAPLPDRPIPISEITTETP